MIKSQFEKGIHKKSREFMLKRADGFYGQIAFGNNQWMFPRLNMIESIQYVLGEQSRMRYKKRPDEITQNDRNTLPTSDWRNSKLLYKILKTVTTLVMQQELMPSVNGIDALTRESKKEYATRLKLAALLKRIGTMYDDVAAQIGLHPDQIPVTSDGLQVQLSMAPQLRHEMNMELGISKLLNIYRWYSSLDAEYIKTTLVCNIAGVVNDLSSCMPNIRVFNPLNGYCDFSNREDCSDILEGAEIILVPLTDIMAYAKDQINDMESVKAQAKTYSQIVAMPSFSNYSFMGTYGTNDAVLYVPVIHASWKETKDVCYKEVEMPDGSTKEFLEIDVDPLKDPRIKEYKSKPYQFVFTLKRIIGTRELYDTGLLYPQNRFLPIENPMDSTVIDPRPSELNFILSNPNVVWGRSISMIDELKAEVDNLIRAQDKFASTLQAFIPQAIAINTDLLAELMLGNTKMSIDQLITMFERKGVLLYQKATSRAGGIGDNTTKPIEILDNNMSQNLERLLAVIREQEDRIDRLSGIALSQMGQSPGDRTSLGLNEQLIQGQNNVLGCYFRARNLVFERLNFQLMLYLKYTGDKGVGQNGVEYEFTPDELKERLFNITTDVVPTEALWQDLQDAATMAYKAKPRELEWADLMIIRNSRKKNYKQISAYFADKQIRFREREEKKEAAMIQMNNEGSAQASQVKTEGDLQKIQMKEQMVTERTLQAKQADVQVDMANIEAMVFKAVTEALSKVNPQAASTVAIAAIQAPEDLGEVVETQEEKAVA